MAISKKHDDRSYQRRAAPNSSCTYPATETGDMKS